MTNHNVGNFSINENYRKCKSAAYRGEPLKLYAGRSCKRE
jgi:hypothetical protein